MMNRLVDGLLLTKEGRVLLYPRLAGRQRSSLSLLIKPWVRVSARSPPPAAAGTALSGFSPGGPEQCSGLPVLRADQDAIISLLGSGFDILDACQEDHQTPSGSLQRFQYCLFRRALAHE
jgi:hypothetical protein